MSVYSKLLELQKTVTALSKDSKAYGYDYVSGDKVLSVLRPKMNELGLILKQEITSIENTRQDYATRKGDKSEILSKVMMRFTWVDTETGEKDENLFGANGQNDFDKGVGSALTYGERYFLLKFFHIATDRDDIDNPERGKGNRVAEPKPSLSNTEKDAAYVAFAKKQGGMTDNMKVLTKKALASREPKSLHDLLVKGGVTTINIEEIEALKA